MQQCAALMVDIRDSRKMTEARRQGVQDVMGASLAYLNVLFRNDLLREVVFSAGDEVQGLFASAAAAYLYHRSLSLLVVQADLRGGVGCGAWDVQVADAPSTAQDGTTYHHARDAISYAKKSRLYNFAISSGDPSSLHTVSANYPLLLSARRTTRQAELARQVELRKKSRLYNFAISSGDPSSLHTVSANYPLLLSARRTTRQAELARQVELRYPMALNVDDAACEPARAQLPELLAVIERVEGRAGCFDEDACLQQPVSVADLDEAGVLALPSQLSGLSYRMEQGAGRTRQSIDRLLDGGMVNQERVAAADEAGVLALPSQLSGLSYRMEQGAGRTRQSIDRLLDGGMVNQERVAAAFVARALLEEEAGGNRG